MLLILIGFAFDGTNYQNHAQPSVISIYYVILVYFVLLGNQIGVFCIAG
jgi:hypothetical protein